MANFGNPQMLIFMDMDVWIVDEKKQWKPKGVILKNL